MRLEALILRSKGARSLLAVGGLSFDLATQEVVRGGVPIQLYAGGKKLLEALMRASPDCRGEGAVGVNSVG